MGRFIPNENTYVGYTLGPVGAMAAPATPTGTASSGGTLAAGSLSYIVTAFNATGETAGSAAAAVTVTANQKVTLTWSAVTGAEGYRIYGRTSGSEALITQVGSVTSWVDTGVLVVGSATPPAVGSASNIQSPHVSDVNEAIELTEFVSGLNFAAQGNTVPTPNLKLLFETSIEGTSQGSASMDCYRDDEIDTAWQMLPRKTVGFVIISRHGGIPNTAGAVCEVWPIRVSSRTNANLANNTPATFTVTFAVTDDPAEDAVVVADS